MDVMKPDPELVATIESAAEKTLAVALSTATGENDRTLIRAAYYYGVSNVLLDLFCVDDLDNTPEKVAAYFKAINNDTESMKSSTITKQIISDAIGSALDSGGDNAS